MEIYAINIDEILNKHQLMLLESFVSEKKLSQIKKFYYQADYFRSLYGECLLRCVVCNKYNITNHALIINDGYYGKPYFEGLPHIKFNLSHSGAWVIVGIGESEIGVDIEKIEKDINVSLLKKVLSPEELLRVSNEKEIYKLFYNYWTLKESFLKYTGMGLQLNLDFCHFKFINNTYYLEGKDDLNFKVYMDIKGYSIAACSLDNLETSKVKFIRLQDIIEYYGAVKPLFR